MRKPCLREEWFIEDCKAAFSGMTPNEQKEILRWGENIDHALSEIYRLSRAIRVNHVMGGRYEAARATSDFEVLTLMEKLRAMIEMGAVVFYGPERQALLSSSGKGEA